jgi:hypothetical protein
MTPSYRARRSSTDDTDEQRFRKKEAQKCAVIVSGVSGGQAAAETQSNDPVELPATSMHLLSYVIGSASAAGKIVAARSETIASNFWR